VVADTKSLTPEKIFASLCSLYAQIIFALHSALQTEIVGRTNEDCKMQEAADGVEKQNAWFFDVQKKVSEFLGKLTSASEVAMTNQPVIDRLSSLQVRYSKQHNKDISALEQRQRKTMEQSVARIKAMKLAKSHSHVEQSGDNWQAYDDQINPGSN
jgi:hypothetical protein